MTTNNIKMIQSSTMLLVAIAAVIYIMPLGVACAKAQQLAAATNDQLFSELRDNDGLNRMLTARFDANGKRAPLKKRSERVSELPFDYQESQQVAFGKQKLALKKKWHRLVDDLIDGDLSGETSGTGFKSDNGYRRKKWSATTGVDDEGDKIMILMKKPQIYSDSDLDSSSQGLKDVEATQPLSAQGANNGFNLMNAIVAGNGNQWAASSAQPRKPEPYADGASERNPLADNEHARRILDDKFGIMRQSIFTTNNHLGYKGVPKFGSDEEY